MPHSRSRATTLLPVLLFTLSCGSDRAMAPTEDTETAGLPLMARVADEDALSIEEMLSDVLFQAAVASITDEALAEPLLGAVEALEGGRIGRAGNLIRRASDAADELIEEGVTESLICWSVIERYFEEAELL